MRIKSFIFKIVLSLTLITNTVFAQDDGDIVKDSLRDISIVAGTGLGGAVLGLSTLSFVEEPKEHLDNILIGGSIGIIVGVAIVAWGQATKSKGLYEDNAQVKNSDFGTFARSSWHQAEYTKNVGALTKAPSYFNYSFTF